MSFFFDLLFSAFSGTITNLLTSLLGIPITLLTQFVTSLLPTGGSAGS